MMVAGASRKGFVGLLLVTVLVALLAGVLTRPAAPAEATRGKVSWVYDGDTVKVGGVGKVRLLGIDALDGHDERRTNEQASRYGMSPQQVRRWAERATDFAIESLKGKRVVLQFGPERRDDYGRRLAYVHARLPEGERDFNLLLIERGLAAAYRQFAHPRRGDYLAAEGRARANRTGFWEDARVDE